MRDRRSPRATCRCGTFRRSLPAPPSFGVHRLAEAHAKDLGYEPTMDPEFAADLRENINSRKPRDLSASE